MNDDKNRLRGLDNLDIIIDRALDSYTPREPRPGLTERVLSSQASVAAVDHLWSRTSKPIWALAAAAALLAVAVIPLWFKSPPPTNVVTRQPMQVGAASSLGAGAAVAPDHPARRRPAAFAGEVAGKSSVRRSAARSESNLEPESQLARMPNTDESAGFAPIVIKPIVMAPIQIAAAN
jgi:hypothetical protein